MFETEKYRLAEKLRPCGRKVASLKLGMRNEEFFHETWMGKIGKMGKMGGMGGMGRMGIVSVVGGMDVVETQIYCGERDAVDGEGLISHIVWRRT